MTAQTTDRARRVRVSKYLSRHLRHAPARLGLTLQPGGWVAVDDLLAACAADGFPVSEAEFDAVVASSDKQRFSVEVDGGVRRVRANHGHSVPVDLGLEAVDPPEVLFHGTSESAAKVILSEGISRQRRAHVHLSSERATAERVGARWGGEPVVLVVDAAALSATGVPFYRSTSGVWLVGAVPPTYVTRG